MGYEKVRTGKDGKPRYTACYVDLRGKERSAGTYSSRKEAKKRWQAAEVRVSEGRPSDPKRARQKFSQYVGDTWLPNHVVELMTLQGYSYQIPKHIMPWFGEMRMIDVMPNDVREWVKNLELTGTHAKTIYNLKNILSAIFTTAFNDQIISFHPCKGVKTPTVPKKPLTIITPEQFDTVYAELPNADVQLLVETEIETGLRWGELTELRTADFVAATRTFTISRAVVQVDPKFHPEGKRFFVKEYPKDKEWRRLKVSAQLSTKIESHISANRLDDDDLLFTFQSDQRSDLAAPALPDPETLGLTEPNCAGRQYRHGTVSAYNAGRCRCTNCKAAVAIYRATRRSSGKDQPRRQRARIADTDGHIPRDWFRVQIWKPALAAAKLRVRVRMQDLRHAHASWLLAGGADIQVVKERLGHSKIATTERYLHTLPDADDSAVEAFAAIRNRERMSVSRR